MATISQKRLRPESDAWVRDGIISEEQAARLLARYPATDRNPGLIALAIIGSVLCLTGIALVVASNWDVIPAVAKLAVLLAMLAGSTIFAVETQRRSDAARGWWESGYLGAAIFPLLGLALISQIFHVAGRVSDLFLVWTLAIAALPILSRSVSAFLVFLFSVALLLGSAQADHRWMWEARHNFVVGCTTFLIFGGITALLSQLWLKFSERLLRDVGEFFGLFAAFGAAYLLGFDVGSSWPLIWLGVFVAALALIALGYRRERIHQVNLGFTMVGLTVLSTFFRLVGTMFNTGLIFIGGGLVIILCVVILERLRRRLLKRLIATP